MSLKLHLSLLASGLLSTAVSVNAATPAASASSPMVETIKAVRSDVSPPLSELLRSSPTNFVGPTTEIPNILLKPTPLDTYQPLWLAASRFGWRTCQAYRLHPWAHQCPHRCSPSMA